MKKIALLAIFVLALSALVACGGSANTTAPSNTTVTMSGAAFNTSTITIPKGSTVTFTTDQGGTAHNLVDGTNGRKSTESGVPDFGTGGETVAPGQSWTTAPWNTAGTFHITCTYHPTTMNLTVTVTG